MSKRRLFCASFTVAAALLSGCQSNQPKPIPAIAPTTEPATKPSVIHYPPVAPDAPDTVPPDPHQSADIVAQRAEEYKRRFDAAIEQRARAASSSTHGVKAAAPSDVRFLDPKSAPAGPGTDQPAANPIAPADAHTQVASIAPTGPGLPPVPTQTPLRAEVPFNKDTPAVNTPLIVAQPRPLPATDDMARRFSQQVHDYPQDIATQLDWQLLQLLQGVSVPQLQMMTPLPSEDRELLSALLDGLTNFRNGVKQDNNMLLSRKIRPLVELSDRLKTQAELTIPTLCLCTDVKGFGVYEPIEPARFVAGDDHRVIVYCEVENFSSTLDEQKRWETKLTQEVVLYTEQGGEEVWRDKIAERPIIDYSRNRRHDFFIVKMVRLPRSLSLGRYLLKVTVVDKQMNRVAENAVPVQIVAQ